MHTYIHTDIARMYLFMNNFMIFKLSKCKFINSTKFFESIVEIYDLGIKSYKLNFPFI